MRFRERLTYANIVSTLCLFILVVGGAGTAAYAHGKIGSSDIKRNAVKSKHIAAGAVKAGDIRKGSVSSAKLRDGSIGVMDLSPAVLAGIAEAGLSAKSNGTVTASFNRHGAAPTVTNDGDTNSYTVTIPGATITDDSIIAVVNSGTSTSHCEVWDVLTGKIRINCRDEADTIDHPDFQLVLFAS